MTYRYNEFHSQEDFEHLDNKYGGDFTYLADLPNGTKFNVNNGYWDGEIVHKDDGVYVNIDDYRQFKINEKYSAWISIIKEDV